MNLFWKKVFGGLTPTDKLEKEEEALLLAYKRYCDIETSEQLKEYTALFHVVKAADFKEKKKTLQNRKFKDTEEYRDFRKYQKLHHNSKLQAYYREACSAELQEFLDFKQSADYEKLGIKKEVKANETLKRFKAYEKSSAYKNYIRFHNSFLVTEYEKLKELVLKEEFIKSKEFWEDSHRWQKTEEYRTEQRYYELQKTPDIAFYESTDPKIFQEIDKWALTFSDEFNGSALDGNVWKSGYYHRAAALKHDYSFANEKHAAAAGKNVRIDGFLKINTISENVEAPAWDAKKGFITKSFNFTSDSINSGEAFQQQFGLIRAKIAVKGSKNISHAFWLGADGKLPHVNVFYFDGKNIVVNNYAKDGNSVSAVKESIKGISVADFYIYSLEWSATELIWRVNNVEVFRTSRSVPKEALFPVFQSFIGESQVGGAGTLEVDWVRIYTKK